ncbi:MAG: Hsp33 family molecular chaperone HslO [Thiotrichaceae bacterium]|nr:Hsp33 family molecular chaperone HslO [Thiotrichaceae bacterium]
MPEQSTENLRYQFILDKLNVRGEYVKLDTAWQSIHQTTNYPPAIQQVLGESTVAVALLSALIKFKGSMVLQIQQTSPVKMLVAQAGDDHSLRAMASIPEGMVSDDASFAELFGQGNMLISAEQENNTRYQSVVELSEKGLAESLETYFANSEQLATAIFFAIDENSATGLMIQSLPTDEQRFDDEGWQHALSLAKTVKDDELLNLPIETLLHRLYHGDDVRLYEPQPLHFKCSCSQEKVESSLKSIPFEDLQKLMAEQGEIKMNCQFCNQAYVMTDLSLLVPNVDAVSSQLH